MKKSLTLAAAIFALTAAAQNPLPFTTSEPANDQQQWVVGETNPASLQTVKLTVPGTLATVEGSTSKITLDLNPYVEVTRLAEVGTEAVSIATANEVSTLTLSLASEPISQVGIYTLTLPEGMFTLNGEAVAETQIRYYFERFVIDFNFPIDLEPIAGSDVDVMQQLTFYMDTSTKDYRSIEIGYSWDKAFAAYAYVNGEKVILNGSTGQSAADKEAWVTLAFPKAIQEPANVEVIIPADYLKYQNKSWAWMGCPAKTFTYTVKGGIANDNPTGVTSATADFSGNVYGIDGRLVKRNATSADLNALPAGLYIFGGRKIAVK